MKFNNIDVKNAFISFESISLDFSEIGVYMIVGDNGVGKSTLIKSLVFGKYDAEFKNNELSKIYINNRFQLISYVPQTEVTTDDNVIDYIWKKNKKIDKVKLNTLLEKFNLSQLDLNKPVSVLSGGEKMKLSIISAFIKETPYIILDEPTNSLDDQSTKSLIDIIENYRNNKTIIIVSHDPRFRTLKHREFIITKNNVIQKTIEHKSINQHIDYTHFKKQTVFIPIIKGMRFKNQRIWNIVLTFAFILLILLNHFLFFIGFSQNDPPRKNEILIQSVDRVYSGLNDMYVQGEKLYISEDNYRSLIHYDDIDDIYNINGVKGIYMTDYKYYTEYFRYYYNQPLADEIYIFSVPEIVYQSDQKLSFLSDRNLFYLDQGRLPKDDSREVVLSYNILENFYDYEISTSVEQTVNFIGDIIIINEVEYEIVGISLLDVALISFSSEHQYGIYKYSEDTYNDFSQEQLLFLEDEQSLMNVDSILVQTQPGFERYVLNYLMIEYPANNYVSNYFVMVFDQTQNSYFHKTMYLTNISLSTLLALVFLLGTKSKVDGHIGKIIDYQNYYLKTRLIKTFYLVNTYLNLLIIFIFGLITSWVIGLYTNLSPVISRHLLVSFSIMVIPMMLLTWRKIASVNS